MKSTSIFQETAKAGLVAFLVLQGIAVTSRVAAQVPVPPTQVDNIVGPGGYPNSSSMDYTPFCPPGAPCSFMVNPQLTAMVMDGGPGGPPPMVFFNDQTPGSPWFPAPVPTAPGSMADVAVGNMVPAPGTYVAGVVALRPTGPGNDVFLFLYKIGGVGTGSLGFGLMGVFNISGTSDVVGPPHIDAIAKYSNSYFGLPQVDNFAITWQSTSNGIMGYYASFSAPTSGTPTVIDGNLNLSSPDVAAVERFNGFSFEDWAIFSYVDMTTAPNTLYHNEWQMFPGAPPAGAIVYDNTLNYIPMSPYVSVDRIDAIDDFNQNGIPGNATFDIVASAQTFAGADIMEYNDITGPFAANNITFPVFGVGNKNLEPVVACGPGNFYTVAYMNFPNQNYYATSVDWNTGMPTTDPNAYQINMNPWGPGPGNPPFGVCVSGTSNTDAAGQQQVFAGWENNGRLWEKYSATAPPYLFRHANTTGVPTVIASEDWMVSPNPAIDNIMLTAPINYALSDGDKYHITDLTGRVMAEHTLLRANEQIDIEDLPTGTYLLNIYSKNAAVKTMKFVKN